MRDDFHGSIGVQVVAFLPESFLYKLWKYDKGMADSCWIELIP